MNLLNDIEILRAERSDVFRLQDIGKKTFSETFSEYNSGENMRAYLDDKFSEEELRSQLDAEFSQFYFAVLKKRIIGYLKINFGNAQTELKDEKGLEIERIYVLKEFHGQGVGQLLYERALTISKDRDVDFIWLGVWEKNPRAIHFYTKNGFVEFGKHVFRLGDDDQTDIMMKLAL